ncbi:MAG: phenylacetate--CoA ligase family protein [Gemmatimonadales bacterium]
MSLGGLLFRTTQQLRGSRALARFHDIRPAAACTPAEARDRQLAALRELLTHAATHVPWYRRQFADAGVAPADLQTPSDLARFPVLTKDDIRAHAQEMTDERLERGSLLAHHSGGSTGVPLTFYRDRDYLDASDAGTWRNLAQAGWQPGEMIAHFWGWNERLNKMPRLEFELRQWLRRSYQFDPFQAGEAAFPDWLKAWNRIRPVVALGYASTLGRFAEWVNRTGATAHPVRGSFATAETLLPPQRAAIEAAFGGRVYDLYGSSEIQNIAAECRKGRMHINADYVVVETEGAGEGPKPLLLTSLQSRAMPFIRYRNEDQGRLLGDTCDCGNGFPLMSLEIARLSDNFTLPGGRVVHGEYFSHLMYGTSGIETFQFHQTALDKMVIRVVGAPEVAEGAEVRRIREQVEALAPGQLAVEVVQVPAIELSSAGKHRFTRSDVGSVPTGMA